MTLKILIFLLSTALTLHSLSTLSLAVANKPVIHITSPNRNNLSSVNIHIKAEGNPVGDVSLDHGQSYQLKANMIDSVYYASAISGLKFVSFHVYEPKRDKGRTNVYWWVDMWGFHMSYDKIIWKKIAAWESE